MSNVGLLLSDFQDFWEATGDNQIRGPMDVLNAASKNTNLLADMIGNSDRHKKKMIKGGRSVRWNAFFKTGETYGPYKLGQNRNWRNVQPLKRAQAYFSFNEAHSSWNEAELVLNDAITYGDEEQQFQQFVSIRDEKQAVVQTDIWDGMDLQLGAVPDATTMEGQDPGAPTSIFALVNEETNGLYTGFTTKHGLDPADAAETNGNWSPKTQTYANVTPGATDNLINAFSVIRRKLKFYVPPTAAQYFESDVAQYRCIYASNIGSAAYENLIREGQDRFVAGPQDPDYGMPQFKGIPVRYWDVLDDVPIYTDGSTGRFHELHASTEFIGPRYYWWDFNGLYPFFHDEMYFYKRPVKSGYDTPDTFVAPIATYWNLMCEDVRKQGVVSPSADITNLLS